MITIKITQSEKRRLLSFRENRSGSSGHWGNSSISIPEEEIIISKIEKCEKELKLSLFSLRILCIWFYNSSDEGRFLIPEDISILKKILNSVMEYFSEINNYSKLDINDIEKILPYLKKMLTGLKDEIESFETTINYVYNTLFNSEDNKLENKEDITGNIPETEKPVSSESKNFVDKEQEKSSSIQENSVEDKIYRVNNNYNEDNNLKLNKKNKASFLKKFKNFILNKEHEYENKHPHIHEKLEDLRKLAIKIRKKI